MNRKSSTEIPKLKAEYRKGKSVIKAITRNSTKEFKVVMYSDKDFERINKAKDKLAQRKIDLNKI